MLKELQKNEKSTKEVKSDTATRYLNLTAYGYFRDIEGRPSIKPPWGTLNAINLNTGEYEWKVPVGNYPDLQEEGKPITGSWGVFSNFCPSLKQQLKTSSIERLVDTQR